MLGQRERRRIVYERLELIAVDRRIESERLSYADSSAGLVSRYESNGGGGSGKITDLPAAQAIVSASESFTTKNARAWRGLATSIYARLIRPDGKTEYDQAHDQLLAWLMFHRVTMGQKLSEIAETEVYGEGHVLPASLSRYYSEIVDKCVILAVQRGLIP